MAADYGLGACAAHDSNNTLCPFRSTLPRGADRAEAAVERTGFGGMRLEQGLTGRITTGLRRMASVTLGMNQNDTNTTEALFFPTTPGCFSANVAVSQMVVWLRRLTRLHKNMRPNLWEPEIASDPD